MPTGWSVQISSIQAEFGLGNSNPSCRIAFNILDPTGTNVGSRFHQLTSEGPLQHDSISPDGLATIFTTSKPPYPGSTLRVVIAGVLQTSGYTTSTNADGTVTITFIVAPAAPVKGDPPAGSNLNYAIGPGLTNAAGDLPIALGLTSGNGTVFSGTVNSQAVSTSHRQITDLAAALLAWAGVRVNNDVFGG